MFIITSIGLLLASFATFNMYVIIASSASVSVTYLLYKSWYIIDTVIFHHTNLVKVLGQHQLSKSGKVITRRIGGSYLATAIASIYNIKNADLSRDVIENIISHTVDPFKYSLVINRLDTGKVLEKLRTSRSKREIELSRIENQNSGRGQIKADRLKREIQQLSYDISSMSTESIPLKLVYYVSTAAISENLYAAEGHVRASIAKLSSEFASALNAEYAVLDGQDLLSAIEADYFMVLK